MRCRGEHLRCGAFALGGAVAFCIQSALACPPRYTIEYFDGPDCGGLGGASETLPRAMNSAGVIVGEYAPCPGATQKAFKWSDGPSITQLTFPLGTTICHAYAIADDGAIVGDFDPPGADIQGFLRVGASFTPMGVPDGASYAYPYGVNSAHTVVGQYGGNQRGSGPFAFTWQDGKFHDFTADLGHTFAIATAISENGLVTGNTGEYQIAVVPNHYPFIWDQGKVTLLEVLPGALRATGRAITNNGLVCGTTDYPQPPPLNGYYTIATVWIDGKATNVYPLPGDLRTTLFDINQNGWAVGSSWTSEVTHGVLWNDGVLYNLLDLMVDAEDVFWVLPQAINDSGQIAGFLFEPSIDWGTLGVRLNPIPPKTGDTDCNYEVDIDDLLNVINAWGPCGKGESCGSDLNADQAVNIDDLMIVLKNWDF